MRVMWRVQVIQPRQIDPVIVADQRTCMGVHVNLRHDL